MQINQCGLEIPNANNKFREREGHDLLMSPRHINLAAPTISIEINNLPDGLLDIGQSVSAHRIGIPSPSMLDPEPLIE
jgi:hypothetical protein